MAQLPDSAAADVRHLRRAFGDPKAKVAAYRARRSTVWRIAEGGLQTGDGNAKILLVTFEGDLTYQQARKPPPGQPDEPVTGTFAFSTYELAGAPLGLGVLPHPPAPGTLP